MVGLGLLSFASTSTVYGLAQLGSNASLTAPEVLGPIIAGLVMSARLRAGTPCASSARCSMCACMPTASSRAASLTTFALGAALFGAMILVPLYYQEVRHESVIATGLLTGPQGLGMLMVMPLTGRLTERFGGGRVALGGVSLLALTTIPLAFIAPTSSILSISLILLVRGVGIGFAFVPAMSAAFASLRPEQLSDATPQLNVLQRIGGAIGTAVLAVVLQRAGGARSHPRPSPARSTAPTGGRRGSRCWRSSRASC